jgi:hypothetical protein
MPDFLALKVTRVLQDAYSIEKVAFTEAERAKFSEVFLLTSKPDQAPTMEQLLRALIAVGFCCPDDGRVAA